MIFSTFTKLLRRSKRAAAVPVRAPSKDRVIRPHRQYEVLCGRQL